MIERESPDPTPGNGDLESAMKALAWAKESAEVLPLVMGKLTRIREKQQLALQAVERAGAIMSAMTKAGKEATAACLGITGILSGPRSGVEEEKAEMDRLLAILADVETTISGLELLLAAVASPAGPAVLSAANN